jgi:hypothetical protein
VRRIRDEGKKLEHKLEVAIAEVEQHLSAAEGVDTVDLDAAEDRDDAERAFEEVATETKTATPDAKTATPDAETVTADAETAPPEAETAPPGAEGSGSTKTPNA